jgi:hypothetical protein
MEYSNPLLWLAWFCFGTFLVWLVWTRYRPAVLQAPALPKEAPKAVPAWLFCEEGTALDQRVQWFPLRPGGKTVIGSRPRAATEEASYLYLTADDIREDHAVITYQAEVARYVVEAVSEGVVLHNNDPVAPGERPELTDGDTLDLGRISRFRFTLTGPEAA